MSVGEPGIDQQELEAADDECRMAANSVFAVALDHCEGDALGDLIANLVGVSGDVEETIANAPERIDGADCFDLRRVRAWVAARTVELIREDGVMVADALSTAWEEANDACGWE